MDAQQQTQGLLDQLVETGQEAAIQVTAYLRGALVVEATAGWADPSTATPADHKTLFNCWSAGKASLATLLHVLAERHLIDYPEPVAKYWPEFAAAGKQHITIAHVLTHTAGIPQAPPGITPADLGDWDGMCARIAELRPLWEPGTATGYHALTFGYILGEVIRRVTDLPVGSALRDYVAAPLGLADDLFFGVPVSEHHRVATLEDGNWAATMGHRPKNSLFFEAAPPAIQPSPELGNDASYLTTDVPSSGTMTATAAARMLAALISDIDGVRLISPARLGRITTATTTGTDLVLGAPIPKCLGFFLGLPEAAGQPHAFGAKGSGGSVAIAEPTHDLALAIMHNRMTGPPLDVAARIAAQVHRSLGIIDPAG